MGRGAQLKELRRIVTFGLLVAAISLQLGASERQEAWRLDLRKALKKGGIALPPDTPILRLRFSPDGRRIAVLVPAETGKTNQLLVIDAETPEVAIRPFDVGASTNDLSWEPSGDRILASGSVVRLADGRSCQAKIGEEYTHGGGFLADNLIITEEGNYLATSFAFLDSSCQKIDSWDVPRDWHLKQTVGSRILVQVSPRWFRAFDVLPAGSRKEVLDKEGTRAVFAEDGKTLCTFDWTQKLRRFETTCWEADTGKQIARLPPEYMMLSVSSMSASRILLERFLSIPWFITLTEDDTTLPWKMLVWDFRSGREVASWAPHGQKGTLTRPKEPFVYDISSDGNYIVEGGNGIIRLYKIRP